jgi:hypothetical protein
MLMMSLSLVPPNSVMTQSNDCTVIDVEGVADTALTGDFYTGTYRGSLSTTPCVIN